MDKRIFSTLAIALGFVLLGAPTSQADYWMPGNHQIDNGGTTDWDPATAPGLTDQGGNIYDIAYTGLTASTFYWFKILDDEGSPPPTWEDPQIGGGGQNMFMLTDASGNVTVTLDRNTYDDGFFPTTDRVIVDTDATEFAGIYATGSWMDEAGGSSDWQPGDPLFQMTDQGGGLFSIDVTISTAGPYEFKVTGNGSWDYQWGTNGRNSNASTIVFNTVENNQGITFLFDASKGAIGFESETFVPGDVNNDTFVNMADFEIIRDNYLNETYIRSEGNIDNTGSSEGHRRHRRLPSMEGELCSGWDVPGNPEPSTVLLTVLAGLAFAGGRRRRG